MRKIMKIGLKSAVEKDPMLKAQASMINSVFDVPREYNDISGIEKIMDTIHRLERESKVV